ncbi:hypothetical protein RCCGE510_03807 [Rhizobium sp. CCGE 510]|nr:hypothetical protein RCCGE510_03807 [Rhizobium sp. CCGE 510]
MTGAARRGGNGGNRPAVLCALRSSPRDRAALLAIMVRLIDRKRTMRNDSRLSRMLHVLIHMDRHDRQLPR